MTNNNDKNSNEILPITLKWNKHIYDMNLHYKKSVDGTPVMTTSLFEMQNEIEDLTGVPVDRQKLLCKALWKGTLKAPGAKDDIASASLLQEKIDLAKVFMKSNTKPVQITLLGSAQVLAQPTNVTKFMEDLTPAQVQEAKQREYQAALAQAEGMIPALQVEPPNRKDDQNRMPSEVYAYNPMVTGLPQGQIESLLKTSQGDRQKLLASQVQDSKSTVLQGQVLMTLGMELRRSYINDMAVLPNGTLVTGLEDGHIQLWRHGQLQEDLVHTGSNSQDGGIRSVVAIDNQLFATSAKNSIRFWNDVGEPLLGVQAAPIPGATTPLHLTLLPNLTNSTNDAKSSKIYALATHYGITRDNTDPSRMFRLPPQNDVERQRRALAEAQEAQLQASLRDISQKVQVWYTTVDQETTRLAPLQSKILTIPDGSGSRITCLETIAYDGGCLLLVGDASGGIRRWRMNWNPTTQTLDTRHVDYTALRGSTGLAIVALKYLVQANALAVSTTVTETSMPSIPSNRVVEVSRERAVHLFHSVARVENGLLWYRTLDGHPKDFVHALCELPTGDLVTAGGKLDATLQVWGYREHVSAFTSDVKEDKEIQSETAAMDVDDQELVQSQSKQSFHGDIGYVLGLEVLRDQKEGSEYFALAAARYNVVKLFL